MTVIVQVKRKPSMFGGCDLAQGGTVMYGWYMSTWHGFGFFFVCVFVNPKKVGRWRYFFQVWANFIFMSKKTTRKIVMNHGLKHMSVDFPTHISIAENRRVDS